WSLTERNQNRNWEQELGTGTRAGGWTPLDSDRYQWLQIDLGSRKQVVSIATQGRYRSSDWTSQYQLLYSDTPNNWRPYLKNGNIWTFRGNNNSEEVVREEFQHPIVARYVRFVPLHWSLRGRAGVRLDLYGCSYWADVISFDGHSIISYRFRSKKMKTVRDVISLKFKTTARDGVLLYGEGQQGDFISLELRRAALELSINLGRSFKDQKDLLPSLIGSLLDDGHWHSVVMERHRRNINFTLDHHTHQFRTNGEFEHLDLDYELSIGGLSESAKAAVGGKQNFVGCMEGITYNQENITSLVRRRKVDTSSFVRSTYFPVYFNWSSFLRLPGQRDSDTLSVSLSFRTWNPNGVLMFTQLAEGWLELGLMEGKVTVYINVTQKRSTRVDISSGLGLNDGQWHSVHLNALDNYAMLTVDGDEASTVRTAIPAQIKTGGTYYFGGDGFSSPYFYSHPGSRSFQGCIQMIHIDDHLVDLRAVEEGHLGTFENVSLDMCAIIDRCVPNHCEHGGRCSQTWETFSCNCSGTGYTGATCHTSLYQQSCEEYRHQGKSSGLYWIDPDGSGPMAPLRVHCDMTGECVQRWLSSPSSVSRFITIMVLIINGIQCFIISYGENGFFSDAFYGAPFTWWVGRDNKRHFYWGGSGPGIQKCACGIGNNCTDAKHHCNCDADLRSW
uniref:Contactin associated protein 2b n=1 Tax=Cyprinodon variegatus TaxID=28743 RepID=A0A3Q2DGF4_CYPVA